MSILNDILEMVKTGKVSQPFSAADLAAALQDRLWSLGSFATLLARHASGGRGTPALFERVGRGRYRLAEPAPSGSIGLEKARRPGPASTRRSRTTR